MSAFDSAISVPTISTGTSLVVGSQKLANNQQQATPMSAMDSVKELFLDMRDTLQQIAENTLATNELLRGTPEQQRDKGIREGETDVPPPAKEKGPGILASLGETLSNLNPFKDGMGPIAKFLLACAALIGLKVFGEKLNEPLANLVKMFKEGTIVDNIKKTIKDIKEKLEPIILEMKQKFILFIEGVTKVKNLIVEAYQMVEDYVMQFDKDGDGKLDAAETDLLKKDVVTRLSDAIGAVLGNIVTTLVQAFTIYTVGSIALKTLMGNALLRGAPALAVGAGGLTLGLGIAAMAAVVAAGIWKLADNGITAYEDAVTDELGNQQDFNAKEFFTRLLVGKETGNKFADVMQNAYDKMLIGAGTGTVIGAVSGAGLFSLPGAGLGALIGGLTGIVTGALAAYFGDEAIEQAAADLKKGFDESPVGMLLDGIIKMYNELILQPFEFIFGKFGVEGDSFLSRLGADYSKKKVFSKEEMYGENVNPDKVADKTTAELQAIREENLLLKKDLEKTKPIVIFGNEFRPFADYLDTHEKRKVLDTLDTVEDELKDRGVNLETGDIETSEANFKNSTMILDQVMADKYKALGSKIMINPDGGGFMFAPNHAKVNSENVNKQENHSYTGGLSSGDNFMMAVIMANKKAQTN